MGYSSSIRTLETLTLSLQNAGEKNSKTPTAQMLKIPAMGMAQEIPICKIDDGTNIVKVQIILAGRKGDLPFSYTVDVQGVFCKPFYLQRFKYNQS